ncbi:MAG: WYL domain-containing protein [Microthrixaceae bacterium]
MLAPAVEKLHAALGVAGTQTVRVDLGAGDPAVRTLLLEALEAGNVVELEYFSWGSDEVSSRRVDPWSLRSIRGHWYLTGWCHDREAVRHFRLDRVIGAAGTSDPLSHPAPGEPEEPLREGTGVTTVVVELPALDAWRVDSLPARSFEDSGDTVRVTLEVLSEAWLDRLLVGLGPGAEVRDSTGGDLASRRAAVAQRILDARYPPGGEEAASR